MIGSGASVHGLGAIPTESQAVQELVTVNLQTTASGKGDAAAAQGILHSLQQYQVAKSQNSQNVVIQQNKNIIKFLENLFNPVFLLETDSILYFSQKTYAILYFP